MAIRTGSVRVRSVESLTSDLATLDAALEVIRRVRSEDDVRSDNIGSVYEYLEGYLEGLRDPFRDAKSLLEKIELEPSKTSYLLYDRGALLVQYVRYLEGRVAELADKMESYRP